MVLYVNITIKKAVSSLYCVVLCCVARVYCVLCVLCVVLCVVVLCVVVLCVVVLCIVCCVV